MLNYNIHRFDSIGHIYRFYNRILFSECINPSTKFGVHMSNGSPVRALTDRRITGRTGPNTFPQPLTWEVKIASDYIKGLIVQEPCAIYMAKWEIIAREFLTVAYISMNPA